MYTTINLSQKASFHVSQSCFSIIDLPYFLGCIEAELLLLISWYPTFFIQTFLYLSWKRHLYVLPEGSIGMMNIREEGVNNDLFLVIRLFWVKFFPRPMWRVQAGVKGWYITCYLSSRKPPWSNVFFRASFYLIDLVSITSMAIWRGGLTWNYQFIH